MSEAIRLLVYELAAAFPAPPVGYETIKVYEQYLSELPDEEKLALAVRSLIRTQMVFPPIALIRERYERAQAGISPVEATESGGESIRDLKVLDDLADALGRARRLREAEEEGART